MDMRLKERGFRSRFSAMLNVDFRRMFTTPLFYIMAGISLAIPILTIVMTAMTEGSVTVDPETGIETIAEGFKNVWQVIGSVSGSPVSMDMTSMSNINMMYFLIAVFVSVFVAEDFRSGYAKYLFTIRSKKADYVAAKTVAGFFAGCVMLCLFFLGAMTGGKIVGLPFEMDGFGVGGLICSMLAKIFVALIFVAIPLMFSVITKQKLWMSVCGSLMAGMLLFMMIPAMTPLNSTMMNVVMTLAGGALFSIGLGAVSNAILDKTSLV